MDPDCTGDTRAPSNLSHIPTVANTATRSCTPSWTLVSTQTSHDAKSPAAAISAGVRGQLTERKRGSGRAGNFGEMHGIGGRWWWRGRATLGLRKEGMLEDCC